MLKKVFALASFTALTGVVAATSAAGCSSSTTTTDTDSGPTPLKDANTADRTTPPEEDAGPGTCPSPDPVAASALPWAPPTPTQANKCQEQDIAAMEQYIKDNPQTTNEAFEQFVKTMDATCHSCVFTDANNPTWGPIPTSNGKLATINIGACFALVGNEACGKAIQNEFDCEFVACAACADSNSFKACRPKAQKGACKPFVQETQKACQGTPPTIDDVCGSVFKSMRVQCVTANVLDAGPG